MNTVNTCSICHQPKSLRHRFLHHLLADVLPTVLMFVTTAYLMRFFLPH